jgi:hypothetical protein
MSNADVISISRQRRKLKPKAFIRLLPASNWHHAIRLSIAKNLPFNQFVTINFAMTDCVEEETSEAFSKIRDQFGKFVTRPPKALSHHRVPPTHAWVRENPDNCCPHAHWLVHVPEALAADFPAKIEQWVRTAAGQIYDDCAIDIRPALAEELLGAELYLLKGMYPPQAQSFHIIPEDQGIVTGKRSGFSENLGPAECRHLRKLGLFKKAERWNPNKYRHAS